MPFSQTHFQNAHHFEVNNSQFISIADAPILNATIINNAPNIDPVSTTLRQYVAAGAMFDSAERYPPGKCHPGTRQITIRQITGWINDTASPQFILWLDGPAGAGKSAIAQSVCELLTKSHPEKYAASFFFARGPTDRGNASKLITTLCYQLSVIFPGVRSEINQALIRDPMLPTKSMQIQIRLLIVKPILQCKDFPSHRPVLIIDGLDECADDEDATTQRNIISLLAKSVVDSRLPLRFMIASRPEFWIRGEFDAPPLPDITLRLSLRGTIDADKDIRTYLTDEFEKIRLANRRVMGAVEQPWPPTGVIDHLVYQASGQFIYASTVLKFVGKSSRFSNPKEQLSIITSQGPQRASAFSELDRLYATILSAYPRWETMKRVLGGLLVYPHPIVVRILLGVDPDELVLVLDALSSLIEIRPRSELSKEELFLQSVFQVDSLLTGMDSIHFFHLSFWEFLQDESRSGISYVDREAFEEEITQAFFALVHRNIDQHYQPEPHVILNIDQSAYNFVMDIVAFRSLSNFDIPSLLPLISDISQRLSLLDDEFYTGNQQKSVEYIIQDMRRLECSLSGIVGAIQPNDLEQTSSDEMLKILKTFQRAVFLAQLARWAIAAHGSIRVPSFHS